MTKRTKAADDGLGDEPRRPRAENDPGAPASSLPRGGFVGYLDGVIAEAFKMPECRACGPVFRDIVVPFDGLSRPGTPRRVRVACEHLLAYAAIQREEAERADRYAELARKYQRLRPPRDFCELGEEGHVLGLYLEHVRPRPCNEQARAVVGEYVKTWSKRRAGGDGLLFWGPTGTNKTLMLSVLCNELERLGAFTVFLTSIDLVDRLKDWDTAAQLLEVLKAADLVVLDEFGLGKTTEWATEQLFKVIDHRQGARLPVCLSTNLTDEQLARHFVRCLTSGRDRMDQDEARINFGRILSRLRGRCGAVEMTGDDLRFSEAHSWMEGIR